MTAPSYLKQPTSTVVLDTRSVKS